MPLALRPRLQRLGHRAGWHIARHSPRNDPALRRARVLDWLGVNLLFDVGGNVGQYGTEVRGGGYRGQIVSFEPQSGPFARLSEVAAGDDRWTVLNIGLGSSPGTAEINVSPQSGASSLLPMGSRHLEMHPGTSYVGTEEIRVETLDSQAAQYLEAASVVGLKLDVQGYEAEVLAGGRELLRRAVVVECEMLLEGLYEGQAQPDELISSFYDAGLRLAGAELGYTDPERGTVAWIDTLFVRHPSGSA
jgi:FkbM family methyltransferase